MATFVLVHGGASGGWSFGRVARRLRAEGHLAYAPSLSGLADRKHLLSPAIDLDTHITDIVNLLDYEELEDVVLAGHSYGGMVITGVADRRPGRIGHLVYLDAAHPRNGESMLHNLTRRYADMLSSEVRTVDGVELVLLPESPLLDMMSVTDGDDRVWVRSKTTPHPWKSLTQRLTLTDEAAVRRIHRTSINCTPTLAVLSEEMRLRRTTGADLLLEIGTGHDLIINEPETVAAMLIEASRQAN